MTLLKKSLGAASLLVLTAGQANAHTYHPTSAPEIDAGQGLAALAILFCVGMFLREKFSRETPAES